MQTVLDIIQYIVDLGSYVFVPILMCIIGLIFGLKPSKAIKAGVTVGIGLIGVSIVSTQRQIPCHRSSMKWSRCWI